MLTKKFNNIFQHHILTNRCIRGPYPPAGGWCERRTPSANY